jgi:hypothetical protein
VRRCEKCECDCEWERKDPNDRESDLSDLASEAERLLGDEEHREDDGDGCEEDR